jgi:hypothetical protein
MWKDNDGRDVLLKPYIHMIVGGTAGINEMVGHYNTCSAKKCKFEDLTQCRPTNRCDT